MTGSVRRHGLQGHAPPEELRTGWDASRGLPSPPHRDVLGRTLLEPVQPTTTGSWAPSARNPASRSLRASGDRFEGSIGSPAGAVDHR